MMAEASDASNPLAGLKDIQKAGGALPPVHLWNPPFCGDIDMRIAAGWHMVLHELADWPEAALHLVFEGFAQDDDKYFLVTPVEKCGIRVDDAPFVAVRMDVTGSGSQAIDPL